MRKVILSLLFLIVSGWAALSSLTIPNEDIDAGNPPQVLWVDQNFDSVKTTVNRMVDTVNALQAGTAGFQNLTASLPVFTSGTKRLTTNAMTGTGSVMMSASPTTTGTLTAATINASGTVTADSLISAKFYTEGTYTATIVGCSNSPAGTTVNYVRVGKQVTQCLPENFHCTSNTSSLEFTGTPAGIFPPETLAGDSRVRIPIVVLDNAQGVMGRLQTNTTSNGWRVAIVPRSSGNAHEISFAGFTTSGTKGFNGGCFTYTLQ